jgi:predicted PurR-regulated permease PerM
MSFPLPSERQGKLIWIALSGLAVAIILALLGVIIWGIGIFLDKMAAVLMPMALAIILAYVLEPVVQFFERKRISRFRSVALVFGLAVLILCGSGSFLIPGLIRQSRNMATELPKNISKLRHKAEKYLDKNSKWLQLTEEFTPPSPAPANPETNRIKPIPTNIVTETAQLQSLNTNLVVQTNPDATEDDAIVENPSKLDSGNMPMLDGLQNVMVWIVKWLGSQAGKITTLAEFLMGFILVPVYLFYFLLEKDTIVRRWQYYLPIHHATTRREVIFVLQSINDCMLVFFRGQVLVAMCVGLLLSVGYTVMGLKYSILLGVVAGLLGIVPYLGTVVSLALALIVAGTQFGDWFHPMEVLAIAGTVKILEDLVISPKIVGERSGLHPLATIVAVLVGSTLLGGFLGALLAIPLTATLRALMHRYIWSHFPDPHSLNPPDVS